MKKIQKSNILNVHIGKDIRKRTIDFFRWQLKQTLIALYRH